MKKENKLFFVPLVGKTSVCRQKEGLKPIKDLPLLPRLTAGLPPQGREMCSGFTLIELLVVVLIISILAAIAVPQYQKAVAKSRLFTLWQTANSLADAEEVFYMENGYYTDDRGNLNFSVPARHKHTLFILAMNADKTIGSVTAVDEDIDIGYVYYFKNNSLSSYANRAECQLATNSPLYKHQLCQELLNTSVNYTEGAKTIYYKGSFR